MLCKQIINGTLKLNDNCSSLLAAFYECQGEISRCLIDKLAHIPIEFTDIVFHHDIRNTMYLFTKIKSTKIDKISIFNVSNKKFSQNMIDLLKLYPHQKYNNNVCLRGGKVMKIFSNTDCSQKTLTIQLVNSLNVADPHIELLQSVIDLVDSIIFDYSLDNLYPDVCKLTKPSETDKDVKYSETFPSRPTPNQMKMISDSILITAHNEGRRNFTLNFNRNHLTDEHIRCLQPCIPYLEKLYINGNQEISSKSMTSSDVLMEEIHTVAYADLNQLI